MYKRDDNVDKSSHQSIVLVKYTDFIFYVLIEAQYKRDDKTWNNILWFFTSFSFNQEIL